jgi:hypothetical protein
VAESCKHGSKPTGITKDDEFLDQQLKLSKKDSTPFSWRLKPSRNISYGITNFTSGERNMHTEKEIDENALLKLARVLNMHVRTYTHIHENTQCANIFSEAQ